MNQIIKWSGAVALVILAIMGLWGVSHKAADTFGTAIDCGGVTCFTTLGVLTTFQVDGTSIFNGTAAYNALQTFTSGIKVGSSGTSVTRINSGTCNLLDSANTIAATTTRTLDCQGGSLTQTALTGVAFGDQCTLTLSTSTPTTNLGLILQGVSASTTQGYITAKLFNGTGGTFTWTPQASSSAAYTCIDT